MVGILGARYRCRVLEELVVRVFHASPAEHRDLEGGGAAHNRRQLPALLQHDRDIAQVLARSVTLAGAPDTGAAPIGDPAVGAVTAGTAEPKSAVVTPELMGQDPATDRTDAARRALTCALVIFGASGDLTERKLLAAIRLRGARTVSCALDLQRPR
jgi:hypothetical protein